MDKNTNVTAGEMTEERTGEPATDDAYSVLAYKLKKKKKQIKKLKKEIRFNRGWHKIDCIFWFVAGSAFMGLLNALCQTAVDTAQRGGLTGF